MRAPSGSIFQKAREAWRSIYSTLLNRKCTGGRLTTWHMKTAGFALIRSLALSTSQHVKSGLRHHAQSIEQRFNTFVFDHNWCRRLFQITFYIDLRVSFSVAASRFLLTSQLLETLRVCDADAIAQCAPSTWFEHQFICGRDCLHSFLLWIL